MSYLEKLTVQGIRSFGPGHPQSISFNAPVTLILGENGTGKTTIIECLKYATTGELPPGSKTQASFIHDPKLVGEVEVKARVGLEMLDMNGTRLVVSRCLAATQKGNNRQVSMRSLDSSIKCILPNGETQSLSSRCADLDSELVTRLGVSKAVLENVIFCHQEESNWPLQEAKQVKQKFDDLFASTRYVKALETIRKTKQLQDQNAKMYRVELKHLTKQKDESHQLQDTLEVTKARLSAQEDSLKKIEEKLKPIEEQQKSYMERHAEMCTLQNKLDMLKKERTHLEASIASLQSNIHTPFEGSTEELKRLCEHSEQTLVTLEAAAQERERDLQVSKREQQKCLATRSEFMQQKGRLELEEKQLKEAKEESLRLMRAFSTEFNVSVSCDDVEAFSRQLQDVVQSRELSLRHVKLDFDSQESQLREELDHKKAEHTCLQHEVDSKSSLKARHQREMERIRIQLKEVAHTSIYLADLRAQLLDVDERVSTKEMHNNVEQLRREVQESSVTRKTLENSLASLEKELDALHKMSGLHKEIEILENEKQTKEENIKKLRNRHSEVLEHFFTDNVPKANLKRHFDTRMKTLEEDIRSTRKQQQAEQMSSSKLEMTLKHLKDTLNNKKAKVKEHEEELFRVCRSADLQGSLEKVQQRKKLVEDEKTTAQGNLTTFKKFIERLEKENAACPLCHRDFRAASDAMDLIEELQGKIARVPEEVDRKDRELLELNKQYDSMIQLQPVAKELVHLRDIEIPKLTEELESRMKELANQQRNLENLTFLLENSEADEKMGKSIQTDVALMDRFEVEAENVAKKLAELQAQLTRAGEADGLMSRSVSVVQKEREETQMKLQDLQRETEEKRHAIEDQTNSLQELRTQQNRLKGEILKIEAGMQEKAQMNAEMTRLGHEIDKFSAEVAEARQKLQPLKEAIEAKEAELQRVAKLKEDALTSERNAIANVVDKRKRLDALVKDIKMRESSGVSQRFNTLKEDSERNVRRLEELEAKLSALEQGIKQSQSEIANHKIRQRELVDIAKVRRLEADLVDVGRRASELQEKVSAVQVNQDMQRVAREIDDLRRQRQVAHERKVKLQTEINYMLKDMKDKYANAEEEYKNMLYDVVVREVIASDLEKYYWALDKAIMMFHNQKISEVNSIVKELWRATYKGTDIDYIQICTDEDNEPNSSGAAVTLKSRRSYSYRVVMHRACASGEMLDTTPLDMRGRCSAGQRVLASLIIRLALAEVFCLQCGLLALDEPTTNLDRQNIESLAMALIKIIQARSQQSNFQLVVITHDEDFVELLGRSDSVEHFYAIERSTSGHSIVNKRSIMQSFHRH